MKIDLSLRWAHSHFVGFVMRRLISCLLHKDTEFHVCILIVCGTVAGFTEYMGMHKLGCINFPK